MRDIICPSCNKAFKIDEAGYADILKQVRNSEFDKELHKQHELAELDKQHAIDLAKAKASGEMQKASAEKEAEIQALKVKLEASEVAQKHALAEALSAVEKERDALVNKLSQAEKDREAAAKLTAAALETELQKAANTKDSEIQDLKAKLQASKLEQTHAITVAVGAVEKERDELKSGMKHVVLEKDLAEKALKEKYVTQIKDRDEQIERLRDMKARLSTKMVGETLEQHCETEG